MAQPSTVRESSGKDAEANISISDQRECKGWRVRGGGGGSDLGDSPPHPRCPEVHKFRVLISNRRGCKGGGGEMSDLVGSHHITAARRGQGSSSPPATQLISLQQLKPKLLQVLHLRSQHGWPDFWVTREWAAWGCTLSNSKVPVSGVSDIWYGVMYLLTGGDSWVDDGIIAGPISVVTIQLLDACNITEEVTNWLAPDIFLLVPKHE